MEINKKKLRQIIKEEIQSFTERREMEMTSQAQEAAQQIQQILDPLDEEERAAVVGILGQLMGNVE